MRTFRDVDELIATAGTSLGHSEWRVVDQATVDTFAEATGDHQWIHVDPVRAAASPFGGTIAHGYLTLALIPVLMRGIVTVENVTMAINYGVNRVRFPAPVRVGSRVRATARVVSAEPVAGGHQLVFEVVVEIEGGAKPACVAETVVRYAS